MSTTQAGLPRGARLGYANGALAATEPSDQNVPPCGVRPVGYMEPRMMSPGGA